MIDPHVHLRDWKQSDKETLFNGFDVAYKAGLNAVFEMPNTDPALITKDLIEKRIKLGEEIISKLVRRNLDFMMFHGIYGSITNDITQVTKMIDCYNEFQQVIGLKLFAGNSTGNMGIIDFNSQKNIYKVLEKEGFDGVLAVHCENETYINGSLFDSKNPYSHCDSRPPRAEIESIKNQINLAIGTGFKGVLHICHVSVPQSLKVIEEARDKGLEFRITTGITPHHALLNSELMKQENGLLYKMNPPLRDMNMQQIMYQALLDGRIDWIETDHAPHTLNDKTVKYMSGIPCLPAHPILIAKLKGDGLSEDRIKSLTFDNIISTFSLKNAGIKYSKREPEMNLGKKYSQVDVWN